jgi:protein disulfide-isomerase A1
MHPKSISFSLLALAAAVVSAEGDSDVVQLKKDTFDDFIKANDLVLAECQYRTAFPSPRELALI